MRGQKENRSSTASSVSECRLVGVLEVGEGGCWLVEFFGLIVITVVRSGSPYLKTSSSGIHSPVSSPESVLRDLVPSSGRCTLTFTTL